MSREIVEGALKFSFPDSWEVVKYDESRLYSRLKSLACTSGVDILCKTDSGELILIEIKDYRIDESKPGEKRRCFAEKIAFQDQIAWKARDTLAGLIGGYKIQDVQLQFFSDELVRTRMKVNFILFLEMKRSGEKLLPLQQFRLNLKESLRKKLKCLGIKVEVLDRSCLNSSFNWAVDSLPFSS